MNNSARFNVLVTTGNAALGTTLAGLSVGQLGVFNAITHKNITTKAEAERDGFYIALGVDANGDTVMDSVRRNYNKIKPADFVAYTQKCYTAFVPKIFLFKDYVIGFDTDYLIRLLIKSNALYRTENQSPYTKLVAYRTEVNVDPNTITDVDYVEMFTDILSQINDDENINSYIVAGVIDPSDDSDIDDLAVWVAANPGVAPGLKVTVNKPTMTPMLQEIYNYNNPREVEVELTAGAGFESNGDITVDQDMVYEQTSGREVRELELIAGGWNNNQGPYREVADALKNITYLASATTGYTLITLHYKTRSESGVLNYQNDESLIIAIPNAHTTTVQAIRERLGTLITGSTTGLETSNCS